MVAKGTQLALDGGAPAITLDQTEAFRWPIVETEEMAAVQEFLRAGQWNAASPATRELEADFATYYGVRYALSTNNGTSALHAAYFGLGLGPGDEVIAPSATYFSTVMPILEVGAIPVFADVEPEWGNLDPADVERKITTRTKAVVAMHNGGVPCEMDALRDLTRRHGLRLVEDAALAHGARYKGQLVGTFGDVAEFSFATSKLVPGIEGGMLVTNDEALLRRAIALGSPERFRHRPEGPAAHSRRRAGQAGPPEPAEDEIARMRAPFGHTYRMASICAVLARVSLAKLDARNREIKASVDYLFDRLGHIAGLTPARPPAHIERVHNYVQAYVRYDPAAFGGVPAERFAAALRAEGARVRAGGEFQDWASLHLQPVIAERRHMAFHHPANAESVAQAGYGPGTLPVTEHPPRDRICLPIFHRFDRELLDQYVAAFQKVVQHTQAL